jgi:hypothetical protein
MESLPDPISLLKKDGLTTFFQYFVTFDQEQREDQVIILLLNSYFICLSVF